MTPGWLENHDSESLIGGVERWCFYSVVRRSNNIRACAGPGEFKECDACAAVGQKLPKPETTIRASCAMTAPSDAGALPTRLGFAQTARG